MDLGLHGRTALVSAASSGLGLATASELVQEGANVSICGRDERRLATALDRLRALAPPDTRVHGRPCDVTDAADRAGWIDEATSQLGDVDVVVANVGGPPRGSAGEVDLADYRAAVESVLLPPIGLVEGVLPGMVERGWGRVIFVTSLATKQPLPNLALSNVTRPGVAGYAKSLVHELGPAGVTVNVLAPGPHRTGRRDDGDGDGDGQDASGSERPVASSSGLGRPGEPEEFAALAAFVASDRASFLTGTVIQVDGGSYWGLV